MSFARKSIDLISGSEIWDFGPDDFIGAASKDCWAYWNTLRRDAPAPFKTDINLIDLNRHVDSTALLEWEGARLLIKFCGSRLFCEGFPSGPLE